MQLRLASPYSRMTRPVDGDGNPLPISATFWGVDAFRVAQACIDHAEVAVIDDITDVVWVIDHTARVRLVERLAGRKRPPMVCAPACAFTGLHGAYWN